MKREMHHPLRTVPEEDEANSSDRRTSRIIALKQLPSYNLNIKKLDDLTPMLKHRTTVLETYKIKRGSNLTRHISRANISDVIKMLETVFEMKHDKAAISQLREISAKLSIKKEIKNRFLTRRMSYWEIKEQPFLKFVYCAKDVLYWIKKHLLNIATSLELWDEHIKSVRGVFGSGLASYFLFLRWLLLLNILNFTMTMSFIVLPQEVYNLKHDYENKSSKVVQFKASDLLTGSGWFDDTLMYYGHYSNVTRTESANYNGPLFYILTIFAYGFLNLVVVARSLASAYKNTGISVVDKKIAFCHRIFCTWDCGIETEAAANLKKGSIFRELLELLCHVHKSFARKQQREKVLEFALFIFMNLFILFVTFGFGYLVYFIESKKAVEVNIPVLDKLSTPLTMTTIAIGFYFLLNHTSRFEYFIPKENYLYLTLIRVAVMRSVIIAVLLYFWLSLRGATTECYENLLGQEFYRLIVMNFLMMTVLYTIILYLWKFTSIWCKKFGYEVNPPQFDVAFHTNDLIYYQTLVWIGTFYSPMISLLFIIVIILNFYGLFYTLKLCCKPDPQAWIPSFAHTLFILITLLYLLLSAAETGYVLLTATPSSSCGPFRTKDTPYTVFEEWFDKAASKDSYLRLFLKILKSPSCILAFFLLLCVVIHYARSQAMAQAEVRKHLEQQVASEGNDKAYLLKVYEDAVYHGQKKMKKL